MPAALTSRPELAVLCAVARVDLAAAEKEQLQRLLAAPLDWKLLAEMAIWHGLEPLLFHHCGRSGAMPGKITGSMRENCTLIAQRNLVLASKLLELSAHLRSRGVNHMVYKGPLFAELYYGNGALRVSSDLDLVVPPDQLAAARDALAAMGFADKNGLSAAQQAAAFRFGFEHSFAAANGLIVDLHWRVVPEFISRSFDSAGCWRRMVSAPLLGSELPTFAPEDLLVALCLHAGQHEWAQLSQFTDIAQLLRSHPQLNWDVVYSHIGDSNTRRIVYVCLHLVRQLWGVELPDGLPAMIARDPHVESLACRIVSEMWTDEEAESMRAEPGWLLERSAGEDLRDRLRLLWGVAMLPTQLDFEIFRLPEALIPLYPWLRGLRMAWKYTVPGKWRSSRFAQNCIG